MSELKIEVNAKEVAEQIAQALSLNLAGEMAKQVLSTRKVEDREINRYFDSAVEKVAKEFFIEHLKNNTAFKARLLVSIEGRMTDDYVKAIIDKLSRTY